jgi:hypothetical protein
MRPYDLTPCVDSMEWSVVCFAQVTSRMVRVVCMLDRGRALRLRRLSLAGDGRYLIVPLDHSLASGPIVPAAQLGYLATEKRHVGLPIGEFCRQT